jgi:site-specific DNA-methyltransferase (adenine-specific)
MNAKLFHGDALAIVPTLPNGSVDFTFIDPPYGNMKGTGKAYREVFGDKFYWDTPIDPQFIFEESHRLLRPNGRLIITSQEPYTSRLIVSAINGLPFSQRMVWVKPHTGNHLGCKQKPVSFFEDILVFTKRSNHHPDHPLKEYFLRMREWIGVPTKSLDQAFGSGMASHYFTNGLQFCIPSTVNYQILIDVFNIKNWDEYKRYEDIQAAHKAYLDTLPATTFNLWQGRGMKSNVFSYGKDPQNYHINQKPIALLEDLIQTFTNAGDTILDFTMGSGSTCVAAERLGRKSIGIEQDLKFYQIATQRVSHAAHNLFAQTA